MFFDYFVLNSEYDNTQEIFVNAYPWLFPGGIGDLYDPEFGDRGIQPKDWARHLLNYEDGRFARSQMFTLYTYNTVQRHANNSNGHWFFKSDRFIGENPPTLDDLKQQLKNKDDTFIKKLRYYSRNIRGSDNYWRARTEDLEAWIHHHVAMGHGPPTFFITLSCAENWWPDLRRVLSQLERKSGNINQADLLLAENSIESSKAMAKSARRYPSFVNKFFMKRADTFMTTVVKEALGIEHYWGRVEFAPGRGQIHLHILAIGRNQAYLKDFYSARTNEEKANVVAQYAENKLNMTADVGPFNESKEYKAYLERPLTSPLRSRFCETANHEKEHLWLCQDCMIHVCNDYCLKCGRTKKGPRVCRVTGSSESEFGSEDTQGYKKRESAGILEDEKGIKHFQMRRTLSNRVVQHSKTLLQAWRGNCDIKLLLYFSDPSHPDIGEIEEVCRYIVAYTSKKHSTAKQEKNTIHDLIMR